MKDFASLFTGVATDILSGKTAEQNKIAGLSKYGFKTGNAIVPFLKPNELARLLSVSLKTLERWRKDGSGPPFIKTGTKRIRYPIIGLEAWADANMNQTISDSK